MCMSPHLGSSHGHYVCGKIEGTDVSGEWPVFALLSYRVSSVSGDLFTKVVRGGKHTDMLVPQAINPWPLVCYF